MRRMNLFLVVLFAALAFGGSFECRSDHDDDDDDDGAIVTISMRETERFSARRGAQ